MRSWIVVGVLAACGGGSSGPREEKPTPPLANDPAFTITSAQWALVGNAATPAQDTIQLRVVPPAGTDTIDAWVADLKVTRLKEQDDGSFSGEVTVSTLPLGEYEVLYAADNSTTAFAKTPLFRSQPYYVLVTTDWDFADPSNQANTYQDALHRDHPELRMTHFVGPYTFTDPAMTPARQDELVAWVKKQRDMFDDEIGLHIHPYCNFVTAAGLTCNTTDSTVYAQGDTTGYTIKLSAYTRQQMGQMLDYADNLFVQRGMGKPRTFRAGGWTASLDTVKALADKGYIADTSALNWARIEEWKDQQNGELYRWNMANWNPIGDKSQPYWPSESNVLANDPPTLSILEVPDNGVMIDYVSLLEMNGLFDANWDGKLLAKPITLMMGFHPSPQFNMYEYKRVDGFLSHADEHLAARGTGPVVYITLEDVVAAYKP